MTVLRKGRGYVSQITRALKEEGISSKGMKFHPKIIPEVGERSEF